MTAWDGTNYLDLTSYRVVADTSQSTAEAYGIDKYGPAVEATIKMAFFIDRANDPTALLESDWGSRQKVLGELNDAGTLWTTFGADRQEYRDAKTALLDSGATLLDGNDGYISSVQSRAIWAELDAEAFETLFGTTLYSFIDDDGYVRAFWEGELEKPDFEVAGLWVNHDLHYADAETRAGDGVELPPNEQSPGNNLDDPAEYKPNEVAAFYDFPLTGKALDKVDGTIALIETGTGSALSDEATLTYAQGIRHYQQEMDVDPAARVYTVQKHNQAPSSHDERNLDAGIVAAVTPHATIGLYVGQDDSVFSTYQATIWHEKFDPSVISSSYETLTYNTPGSPFDIAMRELMIDAALHNQSMFWASGDQGSNGQIFNGLTNLPQNSPYAVLVGGTSITNQSFAANGNALGDLYESAMAGDEALIWKLISGGLTELTGSWTQVFLESVWNDYRVEVMEGGTDIVEGYTENATGSGGVAVGSEVPDYQRDYGLNPEADGPFGGTGRGSPDVSALSAGNAEYIVPNPDFTDTTQSGGTSAAAPLWATLALQINAIFEAQGLPDLGYANPMLYQAAAIAPGAFNDIQVGNNVSSVADYESGTEYLDGPGGEPLSATGFGYYGGPDYDLVSGLGTPNGALLADALATIANTQYFHEVPALLGDRDGDTVSLVDQTVTVQLESEGRINALLRDGADFTALRSAGAGEFAWTSRFAQQVLQEDFAEDLVLMFDGHAQAGIGEERLSAGEKIAVHLDGTHADPVRAGLTAEFGFVDFYGEDAALRLARPVAVATTVGGLDDQNATVTLRQVEAGELAVRFFRVDDFDGTIDGLAPGDTGYRRAAHERTYETEDGNNWVNGDGAGKFGEDTLTGIDSDDIVAMALRANGNTFFSFAEANEKVRGEPIDHLWNYGLNTWGWEADKGGGDMDFNDLVVQLNFSDYTDWIA